MSAPLGRTAQNPYFVIISDFQEDTNSVQDWGVLHVDVFSLTTCTTPSIPGFSSTTRTKRHKILLVWVSTYSDNLPHLHLHFLEAALWLSPKQPEISQWKHFLRFWSRFCRNLSFLFSDFASEESQSGTTTLWTSGRKKEGVNVYKSDSSQSMYVTGLAYTTTSWPHRCVASYWYMRQALPKIFLAAAWWPVSTYIHMYIHAFHGSISVSQRQ